MSRLQPSRNDPAAWAKFARTHAIGDVLEGTVTSVVPFGAFVRVAEGVEGLVHESVMDRPLAIGDSVRLEITATDDESRRMNLAPAR